MIRTLIAEANPVARLGLRAILDRHAHALEIDEAGSHQDLLAQLRERYYEFIIVEPAMCGEGSGTALVRELRELSPWSDILVFTELDELTYGVEAIRDGAKGYLMKTATRDEVWWAVKRVAGGQLYLSKTLAREFAAGIRKHDVRIKPHESFGLREFQVFALAVCGMTVIESSQVLRLDTATVNEFKRSVMSRLGAATAQDLAAYAAAQGLEQDCHVAAGALWAGRYDQAATVARAATQLASSRAGIGLAMR